MNLAVGGVEEAPGWASRAESDETVLAPALLPGEVDEEFALILPFTPRNKQNTVAWLAARSDGIPTAECPRCSSKLEARFKGERPQGGTLYVCEHCSIALAV